MFNLFFVLLGSDQLFEVLLLIPYAVDGLQTQQ